MGIDRVGIVRKGKKFGWEMNRFDLIWVGIDWVGYKRVVDSL